MGLVNSVLTTTNTQVHGDDNADTTGDMIALLRTLTGYGTTVTATDTDASGKRTEAGNRRWENMHITSTQQTAPTVTVNANAGTTASASLSGSATDLKGQLTLANGSGAWAAGTQCSVTFNRPYASSPLVLLTPANDPAARAYGDCRASAQSTTTGFTIEFGLAATAAANRLWNYLVIE